ncbi:MAG: prephenate/arogenate dehydrogenase [Spirulinaceae cyanobacterium SM2_1_0]|nr:prephenate/arogenate dehydrogenase [Spirulinaceae cyanobacterium SM2_1_0]
MTTTSVGIVGLGLIGGSLGLSLRAQGREVIGIAQREETCQLALARGVVDVASTQLSRLASAAVIFICTPIPAIAPTVKQLVPHLAPTTILTDVASVKQPILTAIAPLWDNFVGGHPMAGTAAQGITAAQADLFVGAPYVLTPEPQTPAASVAQVAALIESLGARLAYCSAADHDRAVAWISHLPLFASATLIAACEAEPEATVLALARQFASSGFRDTSRVGGGNPALGEAIARANREELLRVLYRYRQTLDGAIAQIEAADWAGLEQWLTATARARPDYLQTNPDSP